MTVISQMVCIRGWEGGGVGGWRGLEGGGGVAGVGGKPKAGQPYH